MCTCISQLTQLIYLSEATLFIDLSDFDKSRKWKLLCLLGGGHQRDISNELLVT